MDGKKQAEWVGKFKDDYLSPLSGILSRLNRDTSETQKRLIGGDEHENSRELSKWLKDVEEGLERIGEIKEEALRSVREMHPLLLI